MVFPSTPLDTDVELNLDGTWTSVVRLNNSEAGVYGGNRANVSITRGRQDETRAFDTASCTFQLNNRDGRFSPRNPTGPYFGQIGRNTPVRISVPADQTYLWLGGATTGVSAPDSATLSVTGDLDIRADLKLDSWRDAMEIVTKWSVATGQRSYAFTIVGTGHLRLRTSSDGSAIILTDSTLPVPVTSGRLSVRATVDVNNGAGGNTVTFYYSTDTNLSTASWTTLGSAVVNSGTTSIFNGTSSVYIGASPDASFSTQEKYDKVYSVQIRSGIAGTIVGYPIFSAQTPGASSFADGAPTSQTWTINSPTEITDRDFRFTGEVSEWPVEWDVTGEDVWVDVEASGIMRRISQGASPLGSALYRGTTRIPTLVAYWPCEDGENATQIGSAHPETDPLRYRGTPLFAEYQGSFKSSHPIPEVNGSTWQGNVAPYTPASPAEIQLQFLMHIPSSGPADGTCIMRLFCGGSAPRWDIVYNTGGALTVEAYDSLNTNILSSGPWAFAVDDKDLLVVVQMEQNGTAVDWGLGTYEINDPVSGLSGTGTQTLASRSITVATGIHANPPGPAGLTDDHIGQISIHSTINAWTDPFFQANAYSGEEAGQRIVRLGSEEDIAVNPYGDPGNSTLLGYQTSQTLLDIMKEAGSSDLGFLTESRGFLGLDYRPRRDMYAQSVKATFDYEAHEMLKLSVTDDDAATRNDVSATRIDGTTARRVKEEGALSILSPPDGVGRYDADFSISLEDDSLIDHHANWRLHMGTVDEPRYTITVDLAQPSLTANSALTTAIRDLREGDRILIENPPAWLPPDDARLLVQGFQEDLSNFSHKFIIYTQPYEPFAVGVYGTSRYSATGCVTNEALDTTETGIDVTNPSATVYWSVADGSFDIIIGGERMTVTAVTGTGVSQTLTVTRSVNGVVKSHATGAAVRLFTPAYFALQI